MSCARWTQFVDAESFAQQNEGIDARARMSQMSNRMAYIMQRKITKLPPGATATLSLSTYAVRQYECRTG